MGDFKLAAPYRPAGDQPRAIEALVGGLREGARHQVLLGVTGSGKTFTMANVIERLNTPALVIAPNKTLAAQLFQEFRELFPENAVEYFVSYYDYYLPESYIPATDTYIEKETAINEQIDRMRHRATRSVMERRDCVVVASVSCIYGLGSPEYYRSMVIRLVRGDRIEREALIRRLVELQYQRAEYELVRGRFRVRGETIDIFPSDEDESAVRVVFWGDQVESIAVIDPLWGREIRPLDEAVLFPGSHYVAPPETFDRAVKAIGAELQERLAQMRQGQHEAEAQRLERRVRYDLALMRETGFCPGIENYSRHFDGRAPGQPPWTLMHYFPEDFLLFVDESHITVPQLHGMVRGDRSRKQTLVDYGFRLPCALDNRPLAYEEFERGWKHCVFVSATPGPFELERTQGAVVEQLIRPTGLLDPEVELHPTRNQMDALIDALNERIGRRERSLVVTLTKKMSEKLTEFLTQRGVRVRYIHADVDTLERVRILRELRQGDFDVLVGINLLREGIDLPEVSLVAVLDADQEGFLRSETALIQIIGRAARHRCGRVMLFCDTVTDSIRRALDETARRRGLQEEYNVRNGITPASVQKPIARTLEQIYRFDEPAAPAAALAAAPGAAPADAKARRETIRELKKQMAELARTFQFEKAAQVRDRVRALETMDLWVE